MRAISEENEEGNKKGMLRVAGRVDSFFFFFFVRERKSMEIRGKKKKLREERNRKRGGYMLRDSGA